MVQNASKRKTSANKKTSSRRKPVLKRKTVAKNTRIPKKSLTAKHAPGKRPSRARKKVKRMAAKELKAYKEKLINLKEEILYQIQELAQNSLMKSQREMSGDTSGYGLHMADVATDNYDREFNLSLVANERGVLLLVEEALKRVEEKSYGVCPCGKFISKSRLKAIPYARHCLQCQNRIEKENRI